MHKKMKDLKKINEIIASSLKKEDINKTDTSKKDIETLKALDKDWENKASQEQKSFERRLQRERHSADLADRKSSREMRERYALYVFKYLCSYSIFCALVVILQGFGGFPFFRHGEKFPLFNIDNSALCMLIGSTATAIIGLIAIVLKGLFSKQDK